MKEYGDWQGIPGHWLEGGKRWVSTAYGWKVVCGRLKDLATPMGEQRARCEGCGRPTMEGDGHHRYGRGGGRRDDRIEIGGERNLLYLCRTCHEKAPKERRDYDSTSTV